MWAWEILVWKTEWSTSMHKNWYDWPPLFIHPSVGTPHIAFMKDRVETKKNCGHGSIINGKSKAEEEWLYWCAEEWWREGQCEWYLHSQRGGVFFLIWFCDNRMDGWLWGQSDLWCDNHKTAGGSVSPFDATYFNGQWRNRSGWKRGKTAGAVCTWWTSEQKAEWLTWGSLENQRKARWGREEKKRSFDPLFSLLFTKQQQWKTMGFVKAWNDRRLLSMRWSCDWSKMIFVGVSVELTCHWGQIGENVPNRGMKKVWLSLCWQWCVMCRIHLGVVGMGCCDVRLLDWSGTWVRL